MIQIRRDEISRFMRVMHYLSEHPLDSLPECCPLARGIAKYDSPDLGRVAGEMFEYVTADVEPPEFLYSSEMGMTALGKDHEEISPMDMKLRVLSLLNKKLVVAFAGTASPAADASILTEMLSRCIAESSADYSVVSSTGQGIDEKAILGPLDGKGMPIVVTASNVDMGIPYDRKFLLDAILRSGCLVSEVEEYYSTWEERKPFLERKDRISTALSDIEMIIECRAPGSIGGATVEGARKACLQGVKVYAIDWTKFKGLYGNPKTDGNKLLIDVGMARPFPKCEFNGGLDANRDRICDHFRKEVLDGYFKIEY